MKIVFILLFLGQVNSFGLGSLDIISYEAKDSYPTGLAWNPYFRPQQFLAASASTGTIWRIDELGNSFPWLTSENLLLPLFSTNDLHTKGQVLYITSNNLTALESNYYDLAVKEIATIVMIDLLTGRFLQRIDLTDTDYPISRKVFLTSMTEDNAGNIYVVDSLSNRIFVLLGGTTPRLFLRYDDVWKPNLNNPPYNFGLMGISYIATGGGILAVGSTSGVIYRITVTFPQVVTTIDILDCEGNKILLGEITELLFHTSGDLLVLSKSKRALYRLNSTDNFRTANIRETIQTEEQPSSIMQRIGYDDIVYINYQTIAPNQSTQKLKKILFPLPENPIPTIPQPSCSTPCIPKVNLDFSFLHMNKDVFCGNVKSQ